MKPTKKQVKFCELIRKQAEYWESTNDTKSPTHYNDIEESVNELCPDNEVQADFITTKIFELYNIFKNIK